jgi:hypothetical protein
LRRGTEEAPAPIAPSISTKARWFAGVYFSFFFVVVHFLYFFQLLDRAVNGFDRFLSINDAPGRLLSLSGLVAARKRFSVIAALIDKSAPRLFQIFKVVGHCGVPLSFFDDIKSAGPKPRAVVLVLLFSTACPQG